MTRTRNSIWKKYKKELILALIASVTAVTVAVINGWFSSPLSKSTELSGKNNFEGGSGNTYNGPIHVGDAKESRFNDNTKAMMLRSIARIINDMSELHRSEYNYRDSCIILNTSSGSDGEKWVSDVEKFLILKGFKIVGHGVYATNFPLEGFMVTTEKGCVRLIIGNLLLY